MYHVHAMIPAQALWLHGTAPRKPVTMKMKLFCGRQKIPLQAIAHTYPPPPRCGTSIKHMSKRAVGVGCTTHLPRRSRMLGMSNKPSFSASNPCLVVRPRRGWAKGSNGAGRRVGGGSLAWIMGHARYKDLPERRGEGKGDNKKKKERNRFEPGKPGQTNQRLRLRNGIKCRADMAAAAPLWDWAARGFMSAYTGYHVPWSLILAALGFKLNSTVWRMNISAKHPDELHQR